MYPLQLGESPGVPTGKTGSPAGQGSLLLRMACAGLDLTGVPLVWTFIDSFLQSVIHLRMSSKCWGYSSDQEIPGPCPPGLRVLAEETDNKISRPVVGQMVVSSVEKDEVGRASGSDGGSEVGDI